MEFLDYGALRFIWWMLLGILLIGFAVTDGYDLGTCTLLPFVARRDVERRMVINAVGPNWEGHQVWFILGGGAIFAAWPFVYAVSFSGFYLAMFVVLSALILRPVAFKYRSKRSDPAWRARWDWALFIGGLVPSLVFGVAIGNVLQGVPFRFDSDLRAFYDGSFFGLFSPFALLCGLVSVAMLTLHGSTWIVLKVEGGPVGDRARAIGSWAAFASFLLFLAGGLWIWRSGMGYQLMNDGASGNDSNPLLGNTVAAAGAWMSNYARYPATVIAPVLGLLGAAGAYVGLVARHEKTAFVSSGLSIAGVIGTVGVSMFPYILPSSIDAHSSLTVWNASSSGKTLGIMLVVTCIFLPLILAYTTWALRVMRGRLTTADMGVGRDWY